MPGAARTVAELNGMLSSDPDAVIGLTAALLSGGVITVRQVLKRTGMEPASYDTPLEREEMDLICEQAPEGFARRAVSSVHGALVQAKAAGVKVPRIVWRHGDWDVTQKTTHTSDPGFDPQARPMTRIEISTPRIDEASGQLVK